MIAFVPLNESHIPLLHRWLSQGEALRWYSLQQKSEECLRQTYLLDKPRTGTHCFIVQYAGDPIGFLQYYRIADYPEYCNLVGARPYDYGLDLFIGEDHRIGRGIGTQVVGTALEQLVFKHADAERCILGPSPENKRAIRCYEKCGFRWLKSVVSSEGEEEYLMSIENPGKLSTPTAPTEIPPAR